MPSPDKSVHPISQRETTFTLHHRKVIVASPSIMVSPLLPFRLSTGAPLLLPITQPSVCSHQTKNTKLQICTFTHHSHADTLPRICSLPSPTFFVVLTMAPSPTPFATLPAVHCDGSIQSPVILDDEDSELHTASFAVPAELDTRWPQKRRLATSHEPSEPDLVSPASPDQSNVHAPRKRRLITGRERASRHKPQKLPYIPIQLTPSALLNAHASPKPVASIEQADHGQKQGAPTKRPGYKQQSLMAFFGNVSGKS